MENEKPISPDQLIVTEEMLSRWEVNLFELDNFISK
jgi:hypothetical protein